MAKNRRGDVLTSREWEVLALVREDLTNEQIAERLGISRDGAKYHVSEILSKLQVSNRIEAARWYEQWKTRNAQPAVVGWLAAFMEGQSWALKVGVGAAGAAVVVGVCALVIGVLVMSSRGQRDKPQTPENRTGNEVLDGIIDRLLTNDAGQLVAHFAGVTAREGGVIGGPVGIFGAQPIQDAEWASRLAASQRTLHAVIRDPSEPYPWWDQPPNPQPRAAIFAAQRDFDIVLIVETEGGVNPWRFSILDGHVIDMVIDNGLQTPGGALSQVPLARRLGYLTPSPDDDPGSFLVFPDERNIPPPVPRRPAGNGPPQAPPAPVVVRGFAPDGRTGDSDLDAIIESLLHDSANTLQGRFSVLPARDEQDQLRVPVAEWIGRLAAAERSLYAVFTGDPLDAEILLAVEDGGSTEQWKFGVLNGQVVEVTIRARGLPSLAREYQRFYVLPPVKDGPQPPPNHSLSVRTGDPAVDALISVIEARNASDLLAALAPPDVLLVREGQECRGSESRKDAAFAEAWSKEAAAQAYGIHAVTRLPEGYRPTADHLIILITQQNPYSWQSVGLLERQGEIVLLITGGCEAQRLYPPTGYLVPPPSGGLAGLNSVRRSGIPLVDAILDAARSGDEGAMAGLIQYTPVSCSEPGQIGTLPCPPGTVPGTALDAFPVSACEGGYALPSEAARQLVEIARAPLYAVVEAQPPARPPGAPAPPDTSAGVVLLASPGRGAAALSIGPRGVTSVSRGCFLLHPEWLAGNGQPAFLLPPP